MSKISNIVQYVLDHNPHVHKNNTELCIEVWKEVARRKGEMTWDIMRDYKPESIVRKRRELTVSTLEQSKKAYKTWKHFSSGIGDNPLDI